MSQPDKHAFYNAPKIVECMRTELSKGLSLQPQGAHDPIASLKY